MLTFNQKKQQSHYLLHHPIQNIRDMSLLSLTYQKPPWREFPVVYRPKWWYEPPQLSETAVFLPGFKIRYQYIQTTFQNYFVTLDETEKVRFAKECLLQVAQMLSNMTYYVHGDLTIENIMISVSEANKYHFYIMDRCVFDREKHCDLRTLYISISELCKDHNIFFDAFTNNYFFDPVLFIKHIESI